MYAPKIFRNSPYNNSMLNLLIASFNDEAVDLEIGSAGFVYEYTVEEVSVNI